MNPLAPPRGRRPSADSGVPDWPVLTITLDSRGRGTLNGRPVHGIDAAPRAGLLAEACTYAAAVGRPLRVQANDPHGHWHLIAHPNGTITPLPGHGPRLVRLTILAVTVIAMTGLLSLWLIHHGRPDLPQSPASTSANTTTDYSPNFTRSPLGSVPSPSRQATVRPQTKPQRTAKTKPGVLGKRTPSRR